MAKASAPDGQRTPLRAEIRATLALALPLILGNFAQTAINTTDVLILGRYDTDALSAAAIAVNLYWAFGIFSMGLVTAASPLIAAERGRRPHSVRDVRRTVRQACWAALTICIPIWLILSQSEPILLQFGQEPELAREAARFIHIAMWGLPAFLIHIVLRYYVTALERPAWGVFVTCCGVAFNALACWVLVFGKFGFPELGLAGAAIANALANLFLMLGMLGVVFGVPRFRRYHLFGNFHRSDWPRYGQIMWIGIPIAVTFALEMTVFNAAVFLMGMIDRSQLAAHAIAIQVAAMAFMVPLGLSQAATVRVGLFHGRKDAQGVGRAGLVAFGLGVGASFFLSAIMIFMPGPLVALFVDMATENGRQVFDIAVSFLMIAAIFQLADGAQVVGAGALRGLQDTRWPMIYAAFGYWVIGFGLALWFGFQIGMEGVGIWIGLAAGLAAVAVLMVSRWMLRGRIGLVDYG
jgi:MATE family, multidrug efflux pump